MTLDEFAERMSFYSGTVFHFSNNRDSYCRSNKNTLGYYSPTSHAIMMCNENAGSAGELANTIAHETIHAGQSCLQSLVPFSKGIIGPREKMMVQKLYPSRQWQDEYNARAISNYLVQNIEESDRVGATISDACENVKTENLPRNSAIRALHR